jgi:hypothetical protein
VSGFNNLGIQELRDLGIKMTANHQFLNSQFLNLKADTRISTAEASKATVETQTDGF